jgi:hypothetical protein
MSVLLGLIALAATLTVWWRMPESRELLRRTCRGSCSHCSNWR